MRATLIDAVAKGDIIRVKELIDGGVDPNIKLGDSKETALMTAACRSCPDIVKILIEGGANVNARDNGNSTAILYAALWGCFDNVVLLDEAGAEFSEQELKNHKLAGAIANGDVTMVSEFMASGCEAGVAVHCLLGRKDFKNNAEKFLVNEILSEILSICELIIDFYLRDKRVGEAMCFLTELKDKFPDEPRVVGKECEVYFLMEDDNGLISSYKELAEIYAKKGEQDKCHEVYMRVLELNPNDAEAKSYLHPV